MSTPTSTPDPAIVDRHLVEVAAKCDWSFTRAPHTDAIGSDAWWAWAGDVLAVAHNTGRIGFELRGTLIDLAYTVWCAAQGRRP